jgi:hypothetical protein
VTALARLLLRAELWRAERMVDRAYHASASRRIDALRAAIEALA